MDSIKNNALVIIAIVIVSSIQYVSMAGSSERVASSQNNIDEIENLCDNIDEDIEMFMNKDNFDDNSDESKNLISKIETLTNKLETIGNESKNHMKDIEMLMNKVHDIINLEENLKKEENPKQKKKLNKIRKPQNITMLANEANAYINEQVNLHNIINRIDILKVNTFLNKNGFNKSSIYNNLNSILKRITIINNINLSRMTDIVNLMGSIKISGILKVNTLVKLYKAVTHNIDRTKYENKIFDVNTIVDQNNDIDDNKLLQLFGLITQNNNVEENVDEEAYIELNTQQNTERASMSQKTSSSKGASSSSRRK